MSQGTGESSVVAVAAAATAAETTTSTAATAAATAAAVATRAPIGAEVTAAATTILETAAATEAAARTTAAATATRLTLTGLVDRESAPVQFGVVHGVDRFARRFCAREGHEAEAPRTTRTALGHPVGILYLPIRFDRSAQARAVRAPAEAAHNYSLTHLGPPLGTGRASRESAPPTPRRRTTLSCGAPDRLARGGHR